MYFALMQGTFNLEEIKERYKYYYEDALLRNIKRLPIYEIQPWDQVLNKIEQRVFEDIRILGVPLYPIFPVAGNTYLHFGNPFEKIGIEIIYKNTPKVLIDRKILLLQALDWKVYTIASQHTYYPLEIFFRIKRKDKNLEFEDLEEDLRFAFYNKYREDNTSCLLNYILAVHFDETAFNWKNVNPFKFKND